jgi:hypothetical protein
MQRLNLVATSSYLTGPFVLVSYLLLCFLQETQRCFEPEAAAVPGKLQAHEQGKILLHNVMIALFFIYSGTNHME